MLKTKIGDLFKNTCQYFDSGRIVKYLLSKSLLPQWGKVNFFVYAAVFVMSAQNIDLVTSAGNNLILL